MSTHELEVYMTYNLNQHAENGLLKIIITGSHARCTSDNKSERCNIET